MTSSSKNYSDKVILIKGNGTTVKIADVDCNDLATVLDHRAERVSSPGKYAIYRDAYDNVVIQIF